jgi:hypothetical protein
MASINLDRSSRLDITCRKGDTFKLIFTFDEAQDTARPIDGWKMQVRTSADDEAGSGQLEVSGSGPFSYDAETNKKLTLTIAAGSMNFSGQYVYDIQHAGSETETFFHGVFTVVEDITNS